MASELRITDINDVEQNNVARVARPAGLSADQLVGLAETARIVAPRIKAWYPIGTSQGRAFRYSDTTR